MSEKLEKILVWIIKMGIFFILFIPLLVYQKSFYPFIFPKIIAFQILTEIIFIVWLFLFLYFPRRKNDGKTKKRKKYGIDFKNPLVFTLTIFVIVLFLTSLFGLDFNRSFWSTEERMNGLVTILHFYAFFLVLTSVFKNKKDWQGFIWLNLLCSLLVGLYGLGQKMKLSFLIKANEYQMTATLGNPIFLAVYSMLNIFLAIWLLSQIKRKSGKIIGFLMIVFNLWVMLSAASRGVMLAFGVSLFLFFLFFVFTSKSRLVKAGIIVLLILILSGLIFIQLPRFSSQVGKMPLFVRRLSHFTTSAESRLDAWLIGLKGFADRPIFGWGWENYNLIFNKYYQPGYLLKGMVATWFDRSHNQVIDVMSLSGVVGLAFYLAVFGAIFWLLFRRKFSDGRFWVSRAKGEGALFGCLFLSYFIQNLFVFDTPASLILFYFSLGLVYFVIQDNANLQMGANAMNEGNNANKKKSEIRNLKLEIDKKFPLPVLILLVVVVFPTMMYKFNFEPLQQSRLGARAWNAAKVDFKSALYWYQKALSKPCFTNSDTRVYLAQLVAEGHNNIGEKTTSEDLQILGWGTELAIAEYKKNVQEHPWDARYWLYLGQLYGLGVKYDRSYIEEAKKALNQALLLSPDRQQIYFELARIYYYEKEYAEALVLLEQAVVLMPEVKESVQKLEKMVKAVEKEKPDLAELVKAKKFLEYLNR